MIIISEAIISIHPRHANAILNGTKTVELRRKIPSVAAGTRFWIYATLPLGAVIGTAIVDRVVRGDADAIWAKFGDRTGIERPEYDAYFEGAKEAIALILTHPHRNVKEVAIEHLRGLRQGFHPPQVLTRLSCHEAQSLHRMATVG